MAEVNKEQGESGTWKYDLCDCCSDCSACCCVYWCPCVVVGEIYEKTGLGSCCCGGVLFGATYYLTGSLVGSIVYACCVSPHVRNKYGIEGNGCSDWACCFFCGCCELTRQVREVRFREAIQQGISEHNEPAAEGKTG